MTYPTLEDYQEALQYPGTAFLDRELAIGKIRQTGLGLPLALCGGFALTYTVESGNKYAARCFHKESKNLETRYAAISEEIKKLNSKFFVDFEFQTNGVKIKGNVFPVVKMAWAPGVTLGEFMEANYSNSAILLNLQSSIIELALFLESNNIAHGDIQAGNLMVANEGRVLHLIDYDGMYVPKISNLGSSELGHKNFQHPKRSGKNFDSSLDRFSLIGINIAIKALIAFPRLWNDTQSDSDSFIFKANDYMDPANSQSFKKISVIPNLTTDIQNFGSICLAEFNQIPSFSEFQAGKNIPKPSSLPRVQEKPTSGPITVAYAGQYKTINATDYLVFAANIGQVVELIGRIIDVRHGKTKYGKPYIFINFAHWQGDCVKLNIWDDAIKKGGKEPATSWVGQWISVVGLIEPPYHNKKYNYNHISITINALNSIHILTDDEAKFRLGNIQSGKPSSSSTNRDLFEKIQKPTGTSRGTTTWPPQPSRSAQGAGVPYRSRPGSQAAKQLSKKGIPWWGWLLIVIGGIYLLKSCNEPSHRRTSQAGSQSWPRTAQYATPPAPSINQAQNQPAQSSSQIAPPAVPVQEHRPQKQISHAPTLTPEVEQIPIPSPPTTRRQPKPTPETAVVSEPKWDPRTSVRQRLKSRFGREVPESMSFTSMIDLESRLNVQQRLRTRFGREVPESMSFTSMIDLESRLNVQQRLRTRFGREVPESMSFTSMIDLESRLNVQQRLRSRFGREVPESMSFTSMIDLESRLSAQQRLKEN